MAEISFSWLSKLYESTFGQKTEAFDPKDFSTYNRPASRQTNSNISNAPYYKTDAILGREYFMPVTVSYPIISNTGITSVISGNESFDLSFPVITVSASKNIVKTELTERTGTFKELISQGDWQITIRGLLINTINDFPESQFMQLINLWKTDVPISIKSPLTDMLLIHADRNGSDQVVIESIDFPPTIGVQHVKGYEIKLVSDAPFNLETIS